MCAPSFLLLQLLVRKDSAGSHLWYNNRSFVPLYKNSDIASYLGRSSGYISRFESTIQELIGTTKFNCTATLERDQYVYEGAASLCSFTELNLTHPNIRPLGDDGEILPIWNILLNVPDNVNSPNTDYWTRSIHESGSFITDDPECGIYSYSGGGNRDSDLTWPITQNNYCPIFTVPESSMVDSLFNLLAIDNITQ